MLEEINNLHAKFQINIIKNKKVIKLLELLQLWLKRKEKQDPKILRVVRKTKELWNSFQSKTLVYYLTNYANKSIILN